MTPEERKTLAEQLLGNPLFGDLLKRMETEALDALVYATTEQDRVEAQWRVRSVRTFRHDCEAALRSTRGERGAVA